MNNKIKKNKHIKMPLWKGLIISSIFFIVLLFFIFLTFEVFPTISELKSPTIGYTAKDFSHNSIAIRNIGGIGPIGILVSGILFILAIIICIFKRTILILRQNSIKIIHGPAIKWERIERIGVIIKMNKRRKKKYLAIFIKESKKADYIQIGVFQLPSLKKVFRILSTYPVKIDTNPQVIE